MKKLKLKLKKLITQKKYNQSPDKVLLFLIAFLLLFGLVMLSSATSALSYAKFGHTYFFLKNQIFNIGIGLFAFCFFAQVDYHLWRKNAFFFLVASIALLLLVFIPGLSAHYGRAGSWIYIFGFSLQPSEFVKISYLLYLSAWLENRKQKMADVFQGTAPFLLVLGLIAFLMVLQPDMGTLFIILIISMAVYFIAGGKISHIIVIILLGVIGFFAVIQVNTYQKNRFKCMMDISFSRSDICYQLNQSLIAVGSGSWFGLGLGQSRQKFAYLPETSGDSIFPVIAEELGWVLSSFLIMLYFFIFYRGYLIAKRAPDEYGKILAIGIVTWIFIQAILNIGGMIALIPMTGVPLPLVSHGGSAIVSILIALGILINISRQTGR